LEDIIRGSGDEMIVNYPNPFVESTAITFRTKGGHTLIQIIDPLGRVIRTLADKTYIQGTYTLTFESMGLPLGVYYARLQNGSFQQVRAMLKTADNSSTYSPFIILPRLIGAFFAGMANIL
jgi:hypothetical protein